MLIKAEAYNFNTSQYELITATSSGLLPTISLAIDPGQSYKYRVTATDYAGNYAIFEKESIVSPVTYTVTFKDWNGDTIGTQIVVQGNKATVPAVDPARSGYTFNGWFTDVNCTNLFDFNTPVMSDLTLYAGWSLNTNPGSTIVGVSNARFVSIIETSKNSRVWMLTFDVTVKYSNGSSVQRYTIALGGNNANLSGKYTFGAGHDLAGYTLTYDVKGNGSNIKAFSIS